MFDVEEKFVFFFVVLVYRWNVLAAKIPKLANQVLSKSSRFVYCNSYVCDASRVKGQTMTCHCAQVCTDYLIVFWIQ